MFGFEITMYNIEYRETLLYNISSMVKIFFLGGLSVRFFPGQGLREQTGRNSHRVTVDRYKVLHKTFVLAFYLTTAPPTPNTPHTNCPPLFIPCIQPLRRRTGSKKLATHRSLRRKLRKQQEVHTGVGFVQPQRSERRRAPRLLVYFPRETAHP